MMTINERIKSMISFALMNEGWNLIKALATNLVTVKNIEITVQKTLDYLNKQNFTKISHYITKITGIDLPFLDDELLETITKIQNNGGLKKAAQKELRSCAKEVGIEEKKANDIAQCLKTSITDIESDSTSEKLVKFFICYPISPAEAIEMTGKVTKFVDCLQSKLNQDSEL